MLRSIFITLIFVIVLSLSVLCLDTNEEENVSIGVFGEPTTLVDWCEKNYAVTYYIAEFYNTISNIPFIVIGLFGFMVTKEFEWRYRLAHLSISVIGLGSLMFHATLLYTCQLGDEIPMLYSMLIFYFIVVEFDYKEVNNKKLPLILWICGIIFTIFYYYTRLAIIFQGSWGILTLYVIYRSHQVCNGTKLPESDLWSIRWCEKLLVIAGFFWILEQILCDKFLWIESYRLHAIWHICCSFSAYYFITAQLYMREMTTNENKENIKLVYVLNFFPMLYKRNHKD